MSRFTRIRLLLKLYFYRALLVSISVFLVGIMSNFWYTHRWNFLGPSMTTAFVFTIFSIISFRTEQVMANVEAYQSQAFLMHLKVNSALAQILGVMDICQHGDHTMNHENCKSLVRQQVKAIRRAMGKPEVQEKPMLVSNPEPCVYEKN